MKFSLQYAKLLSQKYLNIDDDIIPEIEMCLEREGDSISIPLGLENFAIRIKISNYNYSYNYSFGFEGNGEGYGDGHNNGNGYSSDEEYYNFSNLDYFKTSGEGLGNGL